jgi:hypothetical protein
MSPLTQEFLPPARMVVLNSATSFFGLKMAYDPAV